MACDELKPPMCGNQRMSLDSFEQFRTFVLRDPSLQAQLRETPDRDAFIRLTVQLGNERGYTFTAADVEAALRTSQRVWIERWISR